MDRLWRKRAAVESDDAKRVLKKVQKGLLEGKWYEVVVSEGYVNGEFREDIEFEMHSKSPDQPEAKLVIIYDYFRADFVKGDHNMAVDLEKFPASIESDQKYLVMVHEHDLLYQDGQKVPKPLGEGTDSVMDVEKDKEGETEEVNPEVKPQGSEVPTDQAGPLTTV